MQYSSPGLGLESDLSPVSWDLDLDLRAVDLDLDLTHLDLNLGVLYLNENTLIFKVFYFILA